MANGGYVQGNVYKVSLKDGQAQEGIFISETKEHIYIKLESGYNIGIEKPKIKSVDEIKQHITAKKKSESKHAPVKGLQEIIVLHTGGTIASKVDYSTGAVISRFSPEDLLEMFPELNEIANIGSRFISNMWSEDMNFSHYNMIAKAVKETIDSNPGIAGIIIGLGTDMLHYASASLSFALEGISIPVIIVGSQRSSDRPSTDAALNLVSAAYFISEKSKHNFKGVAVCMHKDSNDKDCWILLATKLRKMHTSRRDAFQPINSEAIATVNYKHKNIEIISEPHVQGTKELELKLFNPKLKVAIIKARPGLRPEEVKFYEGYDGIVLEGVGIGQYPTESFDESSEDNKKIFDSIAKMAKKGLVAMTSQTIFGRINMNVYSPARRLKEAGVLGHQMDMTTETAYVKIMWLLSNYELEEARSLYSENLRGEITERTPNHRENEDE